jgi:uncharacterized protein YndB with AHSA1/START domain
MMNTIAAEQPVQARYEYQSLWHLAAPRELVWEALQRVEDWPLWWRQVRRVWTLSEGGAHGVGARRRIQWSSRLPYGFTLEVEAVEVEPGRRLRGVARGDLQGEGVWTLGSDGDTTLVHYTWRLDLNTAWMRVMAPLMAPVFRWNHHGVMRSGADGLAEYLRAELLASC